MRMILQIETESEIPIYQQITNQIIEGIACGSIQPGDSLPSVRALAADLGVNMHTVNKSYHQLEKKGIIRIQPKSGAMISTPSETDASALQQEFRPLIAEALVRGLTEEKTNDLVHSIIQNIKTNS